ncbi:hypothetical protein [Polyangium mundeleinium]|uniref:Uncharacterized protein n=1 Tax=Polyangium mundeleinium TaxID=2995306 RepID=A0ABT5EV31_9BACT|nr:hypothetical protein [Polyangium mundeleinium]MDC0744762.1 hypothetical protein [Polyangium mundeleinium]
MAAEKPNRPTVFSHEHYHELSADETEARERGFDARGFPVEGPSLREAEQEAEPSPPHPHPPGAEHAEPTHGVHITPTEPPRRRA